MNMNVLNNVKYSLKTMNSQSANSSARGKRSINT